jgi:hypoxanthine phosphoribosyltransferase
VCLADLVRALEIPVQVEFVRLASYGKGTTSAGQVRVILDLEASIASRHVLIVEDILDTGLTLGFLLERLRARQPASLRLCVLLRKRIEQVPEITPTTRVLTCLTALSWVMVSIMASATDSCRPFIPSP